MPKHFIDSQELNCEWIENNANANNLIALVKAYRQVSGKSLRDSKDEVYVCLKGLYFTNSTRSIKNLIQLFAPYILTEEDVAAAKHAEEEKQAMLERKDSENTTAILNGIECACKNWKFLGFNSKIQACKAILRNIEKNESIE